MLQQRIRSHSHNVISNHLLQKSSKSIFSHCETCQFYLHVQQYTDTYSMSSTTVISRPSQISKLQIFASAVLPNTSKPQCPQNLTTFAACAGTSHVVRTEQLSRPSQTSNLLASKVFTELPSNCDANRMRLFKNTVCDNSCIL